MSGEMSLTVAIPTLDGGEPFARTLGALARQSAAHELLVCDSGSRDGTAELAAAHGARVIEIEPREFNHGAVRNRLLAAASGERVALLTQDAEPLDEHWLANLSGAVDLAPDVAIACGPYIARPGAALAVRLELQAWFDSLAPDGAPVVERLSELERASLPAAALLGRRGFFTDANACVLRAAWERVPYREVAYAEDRVLAVDMLRAGYAKAFVPSAAVLHSHDYSAAQELRRGFDEWRALREVYGWREPLSPLRMARGLRGELGRADRELRRSPAASPRIATLAAVASHHLARSVGAVLGSRSDLIPEGARRALSLEGRGGFAALDLDAAKPTHEDHAT